MSGRPRRSGRSPARGKQAEEAEYSPDKAVRGRPKSPGRNKSPGRGRNKSPGRPKSAGRKKQRSVSPVQKRPASERVANKKKASPIRASADVYVSLKKEQYELPLSSQKDVKKGVEDGLNSTMGASASVDNVISRRSTRGSTKNEADNQFSVVGKESSFATLASRSNAVEPSSQTFQEFGGWLGSLFFIIFTPLTALAVQLYCTKDSCGTTFVIPQKWQAYFDLEATGWYLAFVASQIILSLLPIGKLVDEQPSKSGRYQYRCNGFWSLLLTLAGFGALYYFKYPLVRVFDKQLQMTVTAAIFGILLSIFLYIRGGRVPVSSLNPYGTSGNFLRDFWLGREINPRFGRVDIKALMFRSVLIGIVILDALYVFKELDSQTVKTESGTQKVDWAKKYYPPELLLAVSLQMLYIIDSLWLEHDFPASFEAHSEGTGYMLAVGYPLYPFVATVIPKYLVFHRVAIPWYGLAAIALSFIIGYVFYRASNSQKNKFRQNPMDPAVAHLETISTNRGKKLLVSGWWGLVRHPNYFGDIIMHLSLAATCGLTHWLPYAFSLSTTIILFHRAIRDNARCQQRYGVYWDRYCSRVRNLIIPKIF